jgi:hypothetical protein
LQDPREHFPGIFAFRHLFTRFNHLFPETTGYLTGLCHETQQDTFTGRTQLAYCQQTHISLTPARIPVRIFLTGIFFFDGG